MSSTSDQLQRAFDDAWRRRTSLKWLRDTAERLHRPGVQGANALLQRLNEASGIAPDSWFERLISELLDIRGLPEMTRQYSVRNRLGQFVGRLDIGFPAVRLGVEGHSRRYHSGPGVEARDEHRDLRLAAMDWEVVYVGWRATTHTPTEVAALIAEIVCLRSR